MATQTAYSGRVAVLSPASVSADAPRRAKFPGRTRLIIIVLASLLSWAIILAPLLWLLK